MQDNGIGGAMADGSGSGAGNTNGWQGPGGPSGYMVIPDGTDEEIRKPKVGEIPRQPTQREIDEHVPLHLKFKSWCKICTQGEGCQNHRRSSAEEDQEFKGATLSMDYFFSHLRTKRTRHRRY